MAFGSLSRASVSSIAMRVWGFGFLSARTIKGRPPTRIDCFKKTWKAWLRDNPQLSNNSSASFFNSGFTRIEIVVVGVVVNGDGEGTLKRFRRRGNAVLLQPFNSSYDTVILSGEALEHLYIAGKVIETKAQW